MTAPLRWPAEDPWPEAMRSGPTLLYPVMSAVEREIVQYALRGLRGGIDEVYQNFVTSTAAGGLGEVMLAAGEEIAAVWRTAGADGKLSPQAAARLAYVAVSTLREEMNRDAWVAVSSITEWSETLGHAVEEELRDALSADKEFRVAFLQLGSEIVEAAAANPGARVELRDNLLTAHLDAWARAPDLDHLWSGLRGWHVSLFVEDDVHAILWAVRRLLPGELGPLLAIFRDPWSTMAALFMVGVQRDLALWRLVFPSAPVSFDPAGCPTGNVLAPLMLALAYQALSEPAIDVLGGEAAEPEAVRAARAVVTEAVVARPDVVPLASHWAIWLVREGLRRDAIAADGPGRPSPAVELLSSIVTALPGEVWMAELKGRKPSEAWCRRIPQTMAALAGKTAMPEVEDFIATWSLTPEDWLGARGGALHTLASAFWCSDRWPQGVGSAWLGIAFAVSPTACWSTLWRVTDTLRDVVEFRDLEPVYLRSPFDAANLLHLAWAIGLATLENIVIMGRGLGDPVTGAGGLFRDLLDAVLEMQEVGAAHLSAWDDALVHLLVRRTLWSTPLSEGTPRTVTLPREMEPTAAAMLRTIAADAVKTGKILGVLRLNGIPDKEVRRVAEEAGVDLAAILAAVDDLRAIDRERPILASIVSDLTDLRSGYGRYGGADRTA